MQIEKDKSMTQKPSTHDTFQERQDLTGEHKVGDAGQTILAVLFFTGLYSGRVRF